MQKNKPPLALPFFPFPDIKYFQHLNPKKKILIVKEKRYTKNSKINTYNILSSQGNISLTIPILGGRKTKEKEKKILISNFYDWQSHHWKTMVSCYNRSVLFEFYKEDFHQLFFNTSFKVLDEFIIASIYWVLTQLNLHDCKVQIIESSKHHCQVEDFSFEYNQTFTNKYSFVSDVSILDMIFNLEPKKIKKLLFIA